jgi:ferritin-like protein
MSSEDLHAPRERLSPEVLSFHQAIASLREELDAVDWYRQRAEDTEDQLLEALLRHNMREEMEHAAMLIEWLRRADPEFAGYLRLYLFREGSIVREEKAAKAAEAAGKPEAGSGFTIGSLREE